jgi:CheY-like chemotaxis protein
VPIADDNPMNLRVLKRVLSEWGVASVTALGGPEALDVFREHSLRNIIFSAATLDLDIKDIDGLQLARLIAASPGATQIIEMLHSPLHSERARECERLGLFTVLKPLRRLPLRQVLQRQKAMTVSSNGARSSAATEKISGSCTTLHFARRRQRRESAAHLADTRKNGA